MKIIIKIKNVYGNDLIYPVCKYAQTFASMLGTKTLTPDALNHIRALGYTVEHTPIEFKGG